VLCPKVGLEGPLVRLAGLLRWPGGQVPWPLLAVIKCIYLLPTYLYFIQYIEDRCILLTSSTSFIDLPFQEHRMTKKHHMDRNSNISSL
jgi:hypothetical protein